MYICARSRPALRLSTIYLNRRFYSDIISKISDAAGLNAFVEKTFSAKPTPEQTIQALNACSKLEAEYQASSRPESPLTETPVEKAREIFAKIVSNPETPIDNEILRQTFMAKTPPSTYSCIELIKSFNQRHPQGIIPLNISMVPFRRAAYSADFDGALKLIDLTFGKDSHHKLFVRQQRRKYLTNWSIGIGSILLGINLLLRSGYIGHWSDVNLITTAVATYLTTVSIYSYLAFAGKVSGAGEVLHWIKGTLISHRYGHATELKMCSILALVNKDLPENQGELSLPLIKEFAKRNMRVVENEDDAMMFEYYISSGEGFEWVEPDQDPAEIIFQEKMDKERAKRIGTPYSKAETENQEMLKTLPHASLIDMPDRGSLPEPPTLISEK